MTDNVKLNQTAHASISAADVDGNPVTDFVFDSPPVWASSDESVGTITASADGSTAEFQPLKEGVTTLSVSAMIGGLSFSATDEVTVLPADATTNVASIAIVLTPTP